MPISQPNPLPPLMQYVPDTGLLARRQRAAQLLEAVIDEQIEPRLAINRWPEPTTEHDPSVDCAYQALWHFEADESKQKTELFYMDTQLELLRQMSRCLKQGQDLPAHILALYRPHGTIRFFQNTAAPWTAARQWLGRQWQQILFIWRQAFKQSFNPLPHKMEKHAQKSP